MYYVSVGGMQLRHWTKYFPMIRMTLKALKAARAKPGCVHADIFKRDGIYFAVSVWESQDAMKAFAHEGTHGELMRRAPELMKMFHNYSYHCEAQPDRDKAVLAWRQATAA